MFNLLQSFPDEESCINYLETLRWNGNVTSPYVPGSKVYKCKGHNYKCKVSNKYFNVRTGTIFGDSKVPLQKWFFALYILSSHKKGISSHQLSRDIEVTQKTAWFMLHRIRKSMTQDPFLSLSGVVEADETFVGGKNKNRHADKKVPKSQGRSFKDKTPVFGLFERDGLLYCIVTPNTGPRSLQPIIHDKVKHGSKLNTDEWLGYAGLSHYYDHCIIDHSKGQYVDGDTYTNTVEGAWSWLKRMIMGIYHRVSRKHLQLYVNEFVFKYNTCKFTDANRFNELLGLSFQHQLTYKQLKYAG